LLQAGKGGMRAGRGRRGAAVVSLRSWHEGRARRRMPVHASLALHLPCGTTLRCVILASLRSADGTVRAGNRNVTAGANDSFCLRGSASNGRRAAGRSFENALAHRELKAGALSARRARLPSTGCWRSRGLPSRYTAFPLVNAAACISLRSLISCSILLPLCLCHFCMRIRGWKRFLRIHGE